MLTFFRRRYSKNLPVRWLHYCRVHAESKKGGMDRGGGMDRERGIAKDRDEWTKR